MFTKKLWVVALGFGLLSTPVWASQIQKAGGKTKAASVRLTTKPAGPSFPSQKLEDGLPALAKNAKIDEKLSQKLSNPRVFVGGRGPRIDPTPAGEANVIPEPSALLVFGVGLLVTRRAIGRTGRY